MRKSAAKKGAYDPGEESYEEENSRAVYERHIEEGRRLEAELRERDRDIYNLRDEVRSLKRHYVGTTHYYDSDKRVLDNALAKEEELQNHLADLQNEIDRINREHENAHNEISNAESEINENDKNLTRIVETIKQVENEIWEQKNVNRELDIELREKERILEDIKHSSAYEGHRSGHYHDKKIALEDEAKRAEDQVILLRQIYAKLVDERNSKDADMDADSRKNATEQKLERLKEQILTDVKEMKGLDKEREDIFREIHEHERKKQTSLNELYHLKRNREELEKKNIQLSDIVKQHVNRDSEVQEALDKATRIRDIQKTFLSKAKKR
ncbi:unnamed protein product [Moneuplotes crassus]|uniref:Uncharacterized protein n=2 Tax=Euplotes crassus TaxID=5936 RepID=A0AAD1UFY9_EUPCR|nr:unnamed protein product [Moneuplotes crassus]